MNQDNALGYFYRSMDIRKREGMYLGAVYHNIGEYYTKKENFDSTLWYLKASLAEKQKHAQTVGLANTYKMLAESYLYTNRTDSTLYCAKLAFRYANSTQSKSEKLIASAILAKVYAQKGNHKQAVLWYDSAQYWQKFTQSHEAALQLGNLQARVLLKLQQRENSKLKETQTTQEEKIAQLSNRVTWSLAALVVVLIFGAIYYRAYKAKAEAMQMLSQSYREIETRNEEIATLNTTLEESAKQKAQKLVEQDAALRDYAYINSHQLRSALARLLGLVHVLQTPNASKPEELPFLLENIKLAGEDLDRIVREIAGKLGKELLDR